MTDYLRCKCCPEKSFLKCTTRGGSPQGASPNIKSVAFWGYFFVYTHFPPLHALPVLSPLSSPTSHLSHFTPPVLFPKEANKKLSNCGQNALSVIKHTIAIPRVESWLQQSTYLANDANASFITVDSLYDCIESLKLRKAAGHDDVTIVSILFFG